MNGKLSQIKPSDKRLDGAVTNPVAASVMMGSDRLKKATWDDLSSPLWLPRY